MLITLSIKEHQLDMNQLRHQLGHKSEATESGILPSWAPWGVGLGAVGPGSYFLTVDIVPYRFDLTQCSNMPAKKDTASSRVAGQGGKGGRTIMSSKCPYPGKPIELLNEQEFRDRFCLPNDVSV